MHIDSDIDIDSDIVEVAVLLLQPQLQHGMNWFWAHRKAIAAIVTIVVVICECSLCSWIDEARRPSMASGLCLSYRAQHSHEILYTQPLHSLHHYHYGIMAAIMATMAANTRLLPLYSLI